MALKDSINKLSYVTRKCIEKLCTYHVFCTVAAKFFSNTKSLSVTLYFWIFVKSFSRLPSESKLLGKETNHFACQLILEYRLKFISCRKLCFSNLSTNIDMVLSDSVTITIFHERRPSMEDVFRLKATFNGRRPSMGALLLWAFICKKCKEQSKKIDFCMGQIKQEGKAYHRGAIDLDT